MKSLTISITIKGNRSEKLRKSKDIVSWVTQKTKNKNEIEMTQK